MAIVEPEIILRFHLSNQYKNPDLHNALRLSFSSAKRTTASASRSRGFYSRAGSKHKLDARVASYMALVGGNPSSSSSGRVS